MKHSSQSWQLALNNIAARASGPALTWRDTASKRVELSGRVLENWITKTVNFLIEGIDLDRPRVLIVNRTLTWRAAIWIAVADAAGVHFEITGRRSRRDSCPNCDGDARFGPRRSRQMG